MDLQEMKKMNKWILMVHIEFDEEWVGKKYLNILTDAFADDEAELRVTLVKVES